MNPLTDQYNTQLSTEEEKLFQQHYADPKNVFDYDLRGAFKENGLKPFGEGHLTDKWKKPNHPTFSNESLYHGKDGFEGGSWGGKEGAWTFTPGRTNMETYGPLMLQDYFSRVEPGTKLLLPKEEQQ